MSKQKSISEQIEEMQNANQRLKEYEKIFDKLCQINFGCTAKTIHKSLFHSKDSSSNFEDKIRSYFDLKTEQNMDDFIRIMCTDNTLHFYRNRHKEEVGE